MAVASPLNIGKSVNPLKSVGGAIFGANRTIKNIGGILFRRTKFKRESIATSKTLTNKRIENENRAERETELEAPNLAKTPSGASSLANSSGGSFLDRIIGFLGYTAAGWILNNIPTWIGLGKEFIARLQKAGQIISSVASDAINIVGGFGNVLGAVGKNILSFDIFDSSKRLQNAVGDLNASFEDMGKQFNDGFKLVSTPLTTKSGEGSYSGANVPSTGTPSPDQGAYPETPMPSGGQLYESKGGQKIKRSEFGRGFKVKDNLGSGKSAFGHTGQDVPMETGTPLSLVATGVVVEASTGYNGGYGNFVAIKLDDGRYIKVNHLSKILVKQGDKVGAGSGANGGVRVIGLVGSTGLSTGSHMHIDVGTGYNRSSAAITGLMNPAEFILNGGIVRGGDVKSTGKISQTSSGPKPPVSQPQKTLMGQPAPSGGTLSTPQLVALAKQSGMTKRVNVNGYSGPLDVLMGAVAMQESRGKSTSMRSDTQVYGLWQIRWPVHAPNLKKIGITSPEQLYNPLMNAKAAKMIYDSQGITAWSGFTDGKYKQFLPEAQKAAGISPSQYSSAQIASTPSPSGQMQQQLTPERTGQDIFVFDTGAGQSPPPAAPSGGGGGGAPAAPGDFTMVNNFIKKQLLLDLVYL